MPDIKSQEVQVGQTERAEEHENIEHDIEDVTDGHNHDGVTSSLLSRGILTTNSMRQ